MGGETPSSDPRTIWTTTMDRYFIDLMLEQVYKGNRIDDHLFSRRAWKQMTLLFNAKFGLHFNKDNLKNKHKMWWKLYLDVKDLLEHKGFSWDEAEKMVKADDRVWNNYIKAHPKARTFITKSIPYFTKFCKVFGNETDIGRVPGSLKSPTSSVAPESSSGNAVSSDLGISEGISDQRDKHICLVNVDRDRDSPKETTRDSLPEMGTLAATTCGSDTFDSCGYRSRTYWQPPMDYYFIELMLDQVHKRNQFDGTFRKNAWTKMIELFNAKFGFNYDVLILKNRYKTLKKQYNSVKFLLQQKGFVWDDTRQMVKADDDIWHNYIKVHPDAKHYITRPVPYYKDLCFIFKDLESADEDQHDKFLGRRNDSQIIHVPHDLGDPSNSLQEEASSPSSEEDKGKSDEQNSSHLPTSMTTQHYKRRRRRSITGDTSVALPLVADFTGNTYISDQHDNNQQQVMTPWKKNDKDNASMVDAVVEMTNMVSSLSSDKRKASPIISISPEKVVYELQAMSDIDEDLLLDACDYLEDEKKAKIFLSLDVRLRKKWLMRKLRT